MAITSVTEVADGRSSSDTVGGERSFKRVFRVKTNSTADTKFEIGLDPRIPAAWSRHPKDSGLVAQKFGCEQHANSAYVWTVTVEYSTVSQAAGALENMSQEYTPEMHENPLLRPARIRWSLSQYRRAITEAQLVYSGSDPALVANSTANGGFTVAGTVLPWNEMKTGEGGVIPICNSAGEPFLSAVEIDDSRIHITIEKNISAPQLWFFDFSDAVNDTPFNIDGLSAPKGTVKVQNIGIGETQFENGFRFRAMTIELHHQKEGWDLVIADRGLNQYVKTTTSTSLFAPVKRQKIYDLNGAPVSTPVLLDGQGGRMVANANPGFVIYRPYKLKSFAQLAPYLV